MKIAFMSNFAVFVAIFMTHTYIPSIIGQTLAWQVDYNNQGRIMQNIDPAGRITKYSYTSAANGNLQSITMTPPEGSPVTWRFDSDGRLAGMIEGEGEVVYRYDIGGRLTAIERVGAPAICYSYDDDDRIAELRVGDFYRIAWTFDFLGRIARIETPAGPITYEYQTGVNTVVRALPNGIKTFWKRQTNGELTEITHGYFAKPDDTSYSILAQYTYTHGPDGRITAIHELSQRSDFVRHYSYDTMGRLILGTGPDGRAYAYDYDLVGNRIRARATDQPEQVCTYDWAGRLTSVNGDSCSYDGCGNLNSIVSKDSKMNFQYNQDCQLTNVNDQVFYKYDGDGKLVERQSDGEKINFISDPLSDFWQPLVMDNKTEGRTLLIWDGDAPLITIKDGEPEYILSDHLGSARLIVDEQGKVKQFFDYDPFGCLENGIHSNGLTPSFSGLFYDSQVKLYLTRSRAYNPSLGNFLQTEPSHQIPSGSQKEFSLYAYCGNDPVNFIDLNGAWPKWIWGPENMAWQLLQIAKDDFNYFWFTPTRDDVINQIMNNAINKSQYQGDYEQAFVLTNKWRSNLELYKADNPYAKIPTAAEFQIAENTMFARYMPFAGLLTPFWSVAHYQAEKSGLKPAAFGLDGDTWQRQTWKTVAYPIIGGIQGAIKWVDDFFARPVYGDEISPSPVGGVYLGGAGQLIAGLGVLKGVRIDDNGNLFLISEEQGDVKLPPLRIDDVVTVFRSVYLYGEGPTVTIDPNPENPEKSAMIIRHGAATEETYVGWVLYEADRLMKSYTQGVDNITQKDLVSRVPGYTDVVNSIYFGAGDPIASQKGGIWERFWIVPAETRRFEGARRELTLFDVPLKVKTQKMKWEKDKLVDDPNGKSSPGALAFTSWFTANYDSIAAEQYLTPPEESGITTPVPVFAELRRIALLTAIAEKLRDQNVSMPFWMHDYEVRKVSFEKFTPGLEVTWHRTNGDVMETANIFGGVQLSAENKVVKTYATPIDVENAPQSIKVELDRSIKLASKMEQAIADVFSPLATTPLTVQQFETDNQEYQAVSVPGAKTKELGPCRLDEIDITVTVDGGNDIQLSRSYNSFFHPKGPWDQGWALDLPHLVEIRVPVNRDGSSSSYTFGYELITPLNSLYGRLLNGIPVLGFSNPTSPILDQTSPFRSMTEDQPAFLKDTTTRLLLLKNGQEWHFALHGDLVAVKDGPQITVYERGTEGQLTRIVGLLGGLLVGEIKLEYAVDRKLTKAVGASFDNPPSQPIEVTYAYDDTGRLIGVTSNEGTIGYRYEGNWVSAVTWQDKVGSPIETLRSFQYSAQGQMLAETTDSLTVAHAITRTPNGLMASSRVNQSDSEESDMRTMVAQYDQHMRPTKVVSSEGDSTTWSYPAAGGIEMIIKTADQQTVKVSDSPDGNKRTLERNGVPWIIAQFDDGGRLSNLSRFGRSVLTQEWRPDGQLASAETAAQGVSLQYDAHDLLSSILVHPVNSGEELTEWQQTKMDRKGRPIEVTDYTGLRVQMNYDGSGAPVAIVQQTPDGNYGYKINRDGQGRIDTVNSSWGNTVYEYDKTGNLQGIVTTRGNKSASVELSDGRVRAMTGFDSGRTCIEYDQDGPVAGMPRSILCPDGLQLNYEYDFNDRLSSIKVGKDRRVRLEYDQQGRMITYAWELEK